MDPSVTLDRDRLTIELQPFDQRGETAKGVTIRPQVHRAHIRSSRPQRGDHRDSVAKGAAAQDFCEDVLERAVAAVDDEQVDFLRGQLAERLGHHADVVGLDVDDVRMASQEVEHSAHLFLALARAQIIDDTDSQWKLHVAVIE